MTRAPLDGRVVVVGVDQRASAVALGARGATVVVVGPDADAVGEVVRDVAATGARVAAFVGDPSVAADADALSEMVAELFDAWSDARRRKIWLEEPNVKMRTATKPKSMRLGWPDGTVVALWFMPKGGAKSTVSVQHTRLPDRASADRMKTYWSARLDALQSVLSE